MKNDYFAEYSSKMFPIIYGVALITLFYTIYNIYYSYTAPFPFAQVEAFNYLAEARNYRLAGDLLMLASFPLCGAYYAWNNSSFRHKYPFFLILFLILINLNRVNGN